MLIQPRNYAVPARKTQELASLLSLVNNDSARAMAIIREITYYNPNRQINWYYERAMQRGLGGLPHERHRGARSEAAKSSQDDDLGIRPALKAAKQHWRNAPFKKRSKS